MCVLCIVKLSIYSFEMKGKWMEAQLYFHLSEDFCPDCISVVLCPAKKLGDRTLLHYIMS